MGNNYKVHCLSEAISPITHMMGNNGNESILNKEVILHEGILKNVPVLSGNAIRHRLVRETGAMHLVRSIGLEGKLTVNQANYLFNGGSLTDSSRTENMSKIADMQHLLPLVRLLGGSLTNQVVSGSLIASRGMLVCEENKHIISKMMPKEFTMPADRLRSATDFISNYHYTRGDVKKNSKVDLANEYKDIGDGALLKVNIEKEKSNQMIYNGQTIVAGAIFYHNFILNNVKEVELGALMTALGEWAKQDGTIGGSARIGHGKLRTWYFVESEEAIDVASCINSYINHTIENKDSIIKWLNNAFSAKDIKEVKKAKQ